MFSGLLRGKSTFCFHRRYFQALYVSNKRTKKNLRLLTPKLDYRQRLNNPKGIDENLKRRNVSSHDVDDILAQWEMHSFIQSNKNEIESMQSEISRKLKKVRKEQTPQIYDNIKRLYTLELEALQEDLHCCTGSLNDVEENFINTFLSLPNDTKSSTPEESHIILSHGPRLNEDRPHHLIYNDSIEFYNNTAYFLKNIAAKFHDQFRFHCLNHFRTHKFIDFCNPDFAKSILIEGAGMDLKDFYEIPHQLDMHHTNLTHLVGNSSMTSFLGFLLKLQVYTKFLPMRLITTGSEYNRSDNNAFSLYNACQSSTVQLFEAGTEDQMNEKFDETLNIISSMFQRLDIHFRILYVPARELQWSTGFSAKVQMYSPHSKNYIDVANLNYYGDYISKRILFSYVKEKKNNVIDFPHIISGTACNLTNMLAIILETYNGQIPDNLLKNF